ncbi:MAG: hypothetical protein ABI178_05825 [Rhodanobacter sp.]
MPLSIASLPMLTSSNRTRRLKNQRVILVIVGGKFDRSLGANVWQHQAGDKIQGNSLRDHRNKTENGPLSPDFEECAPTEPVQVKSAFAESRPTAKVLIMAPANAHPVITGGDWVPSDFCD